MKRQSLFAGGITVAVLAVACQTPQSQTDRTAVGAVAGGAIGAGTGAIIGSTSGNAGEGALIGGAIGALSGAIIGNSIDQSQRERVQQQSPQTMTRVETSQPLGLADIKALVRSGVSDDIIISQIRNSRTVYRLSTAEILDLKDAGVSNRVIDFMINSPSLYPPPPPPPSHRYY